MTRIVVNHLTRMNTASRICVAGLDPATDRHVRPITRRNDPLTRDLLGRNGGPFDIGALVDLGETTPAPDRPEVEDHLFASAAASVVGRLDGDDYAQLLERAAEDDLESIFGPDLERATQWRLAVDAGFGQASLGVLRGGRRPAIEIDSYEGKDRVQLRLNDCSPPAFLSVTDVRYYADDNSIDRRAVESTARRLGRGVDLFLMLGLSRAWRKPGDDQDRHWLQVNGICLVDRPLGTTP